MNEGWIKLHRGLLDWEWHDSPNVMTVWVHLLLMANTMDVSWHGNLIKRGQVVTSIHNLSVMCGLTEKQTRIAVDKLKSAKQIETKGANKFTMITISKYDTYQLGCNEEGQTKDKQRANEGQTKGDNIRIKEYKNKENIIGGDTCVCTCVREEDVLVGIRDFYEQMGKVYVPNTTTMQDAKEICGHLRVAYGENATKEQWDGFLKTAWANCEDWQWIRDNFTLSTISRKFTEIINHKKNERSNNNRGASGLLIVHTPSNGSSTDF